MATDRLPSVAELFCSYLQGDLDSQLPQSVLFQQLMTRNLHGGEGMPGRNWGAWIAAYPICFPPVSYLLDSWQITFDATRHNHIQSSITCSLSSVKFLIIFSLRNVNSQIVNSLYLEECFKKESIEKQTKVMNSLVVEDIKKPRRTHDVVSPRCDTNWWLIELCSWC